MKFIIAGRMYEIGSLDSIMDQAFLDLHAAYLSNQPLNWEKFKKQAINFFDQNYNKVELTEKYFQNFTIIWGRFLNEGLWDQAENVWNLALEPAIEWEANNAGKRIHKGGPYYFWGMTAIQRGDLDRGYSFMHQALEEDVLTYKTNNPDTPAFAFAALNYSKIDQAFRPWVLMEGQYLEKRISEYCTIHNRTFNLVSFQAKFLQSPPNVESIYLLAYTVARLIRLENTPHYLLSSPFAGQLLQNILFDLVQIVDITIADKNRPNWKMIDHINFLSRRIGQSIIKRDLGDVNSRFQINLLARQSDGIVTMVPE
jgi:hypothetical protein